MTGIEQWFGYAVLAIIVGFVLYDMLSVWAALRMAALAGRRVEEMLLDDEDDDLDEPEYPMMANVEEDNITSAHENR